MTFHSKTILVVPRPDGVLVSVDGVSHYKDMSSDQLLWMAERFLKVGLEARRAEKATEEEAHRPQETDL